MANLKKQTAEGRHSSQLSVSSTKEALTALSELVDFDGEPGMNHIQEDIERGVAHPVSGMSELEERVNDLDNSWETESLLADMLEDLTDENVTNGKLLPELVKKTLLEREHLIFRFTQPEGLTNCCFQTPTVAPLKRPSPTASSFAHWAQRRSSFALSRLALSVRRSSSLPSTFALPPSLRDSPMKSTTTC